MELHGPTPNYTPVIHNPALISWQVLTITRLFDAVLELLRERDLRPVTLDEMFGTSRRIG